MTKRKSCPVNRRDVIDVEGFNQYDNRTYHGTETVRGLNKFDRQWFYNNNVAIVFASKTFFGRTFVVPYLDIEGKRYWILDKNKADRKNNNVVEVAD